MRQNILMIILLLGLLLGLIQLPKGQFTPISGIIGQLSKLSQFYEKFGQIWAIWLEKNNGFFLINFQINFKSPSRKWRLKFEDLAQEKFKGFIANDPGLAR